MNLPIHPLNNLPTRGAAFLLRAKVRIILHPSKEMRKNLQVGQRGRLFFMVAVQTLDGSTIRTWAKVREARYSDGEHTCQVPTRLPKATPAM